MNSSLPATSPSLSFADIAHGNISFDSSQESDRLILALLDTPWVQRLRRVSQTGNTRFVYMFAEHSRFGHSLGVAYLATALLNSLEKRWPSQVKPYRNAVAAAAILHDIGHLAPGSHLAERVWARETPLSHESISLRIIREDEQIQQILSSFGKDLPAQVEAILAGKPSVPEWTVAIISGDGWNADRGNWSIVDSTLCAVSYGRYNVSALLDSFHLTPNGQLLLAENRVDALSHFFVARDSMYRQIYQHRVLQAVDGLTASLVRRLRDLQGHEVGARLPIPGIFCDEVMEKALSARNISTELDIDSFFSMSEEWWGYHLSRWCSASDRIVADLAQRLRDRNLLKTVRIESKTDPLLKQAEAYARQLGFDPRYYCLLIDSSDTHRKVLENPPLVLLDNGAPVPVIEIEPVIANLFQKSSLTRLWIALPEEVKKQLGRAR